MPAEITYWEAGEGVGSATVPGLPIRSDQVAVGTGSLQSGLTPDGAEYVSISATENMRFAYGLEVTATATAGVNGHYIGAGAERWVLARGGYKVAVIRPA